MEKKSEPKSKSKPSWIFTEEKIENSPSRKCNMNAETELRNRQHTAMFIQDVADVLRLYPFYYVQIVYFNCNVFVFVYTVSRNLYDPL